MFKLSESFEDRFQP